MATNIKQNGITFNYDNTKGVGAALGGVYTHLNNKESGKYFYDEDAPKVLMALDIDWNGAKPGIGEGDNGIQTTGELLSLIKTIHTKRMEVIRREFAKQHNSQRLGEAEYP